jgi:hypothetical protein
MSGLAANGRKGLLTFCKGDRYVSEFSHPLTFFEKEDHYKNCLEMLRQLEEGEPGKAKVSGQWMNVDITQTWNVDWFNQSISTTPKFLRLDYDTSTHYELPLDVLQQLFDAGLESACLEIYYDQVGEFGQFHFMDGQLVDKESICDKYCQISAIVDEQFEHDSDELDEDGYSRPSSIRKLVKDKATQEKEAGEMVDAIMSLAKVSRESGQNPIEIAKSLMILRAAVKGLLQAFGFGIVAVLLFKGMWLWIGTAIVLAVVLPMIYISQASAEFGDDEDPEGNSAGDSEEGEATC